MIRTAFVTVALALAACSPPDETKTADNAAETPVTPAAAPGCVVEAPARDLAIGGQTYRVETRAEGATCPESVAQLRLRAPGGAAIFETAYPINQVPLAFNAMNSDEARLATELEGWSQNVAQNSTAESLPAWASGAAKPEHFNPAVGRDAYEAARTARRPLFCFPDGGESNACVAIDTSAQTAVLLGSWTPERP